VVIETYLQGNVPGGVREEVARLDRLAWPTSTGEDHDPTLDPLRVVLRVDGAAVATLAILSKSIHHAGRSWAASGLSAVVTDPDHRRRGHGHRLVSAARDLMPSRGAELGLFTCDHELVRFYESAGWTILPGTVLVGGTPSDPFPSDQLDKVTLAAFFSAEAQAHADDFVGARIPLYPGVRDKLW
jgi:GNAT superfamily N-acetyltransferase